jgi:hypothetical protein
MAEEDTTIRGGESRTSDFGAAATPRDRDPASGMGGPRSESLASNSTSGKRFGRFHASMGDASRMD